MRTLHLFFYNYFTNVTFNPKGVILYGSFQNYSDRQKPVFTYITTGQCRAILKIHVIYVYLYSGTVSRHWCAHTRVMTGKGGVVYLCAEVTPQEVPAGVNTRVYYFLLSGAAKDRKSARDCVYVRAHVTRLCLYWSLPRPPLYTNPFDSYKTGRGAGTRDYPLPPTSYISPPTTTTATAGSSLSYIRPSITAGAGLILNSSDSDDGDGQNSVADGRELRVLYGNHYK